mmetsp:Transcript_174466/g.559285  ORF Transcript_174466/g.559285 Transcript_174466/m.559285 type:complete len:261 (-) Transcript_174466:117-899(-)
MQRGSHSSGPRRLPRQMHSDFGSRQRAEGRHPAWTGGAVPRRQRSRPPTRPTANRRRAPCRAPGPASRPGAPSARDPFRQDTKGGLLQCRRSRRRKPSRAPRPAALVAPHGRRQPLSAVAAGSGGRRWDPRRVSTHSTPRQHWQALVASRQTALRSVDSASARALRARSPGGTRSEAAATSSRRRLRATMASRRPLRSNPTPGTAEEQTAARSSPQHPQQRSRLIVRATQSAAASPRCPSPGPGAAGRRRCARRANPAKR